MSQLSAAARALALLLFATAAPSLAAPAAAPAESPAETIAPEIVSADFTALYETLQASHFNLYARRSKADYDRLFQAMQAGITAPMTRAEAIALYQRFMAHGRIAHARIDAAGEAYGRYRSAGGAAFPLGIRMQGDRMFVARNRSGVADVHAGDEILSINGEPAVHWRDSAGQIISADTPYMLGAMLEWDFPRVVWTRLGSVPAFTLRLRRPGSADVTVAVPARTADEMKAAEASQAPQLALSWTKREARMLDNGIAYLRPGPTYNAEGDEAHMYDNSGFRIFIDKAFADFRAAGATQLLIDLRDNPGGDNSFSDLMIAWFADRPFRFNSKFRIKVSPATVASNAARLTVAGNDPTGISAKMAAAFKGVAPGTIIDFPIPEAQPRAGDRFTGGVHALINRHSYSNTVAMAATIQDYRFGSIIGEETSDLATTYGAMEQFKLPRTGIAVGYPKALIVRPNGNMADCGVVPDTAITTPIVESPDDPVLQAAVARLRQAAAR